ncbi:MAG: sensor histidine kinase [Planctomycetota bacterium]
MKSRRVEFLRRYQKGLRDYVAKNSAVNLQLARRMGRLAVLRDVETLELADIHEQALAALILLSESDTVRCRKVKRARAFFAEALLPIEETHRSARKASEHLRKLNSQLSERTAALANSNRKLKLQIARRRVIERNLRASELRSSLLLSQSTHLQSQLRRLSRQILSAHEEERRKISRELHDVVAQVLTGINVELASLKEESGANSKRLSQKISRTQKLVEKSVDIVHQFARDLRPAVLDDLGLIPALHAFMKNLTKQTGIRMSLTASPELEALDNPRRTVLYRVVQEALTNVARHSKASRVNVSIRKLANTVRLQVNDNGRSFDAKHVLHASRIKRLGILGMRERVEMVGGEFRVESAPGHGTMVEAKIPLNTKQTVLKKREVE